MSHVALNIGAWQINMRIKQKNLDESMGRRGGFNKGHSLIDKMLFFIKAVKDLINPHTAVDGI
ncbi:MAG: hypothetical protein CL465_04190 [Acidimicrobiaceae bacterium]|nr:hypothetical protein [Acidimicrobiaceae bacterium]|tara:strand:+ start:60 stop:248 length:189 start_codon:yes stop_codon:yes gene_type:complete